MFIIIVKYKKPFDEVNKYLEAHREFLDECYSKNLFITSGPLNPRTGGVIISQLKNIDELRNILKNDPFKIQDVADYELIEFIPSKHHKDFEKFISAGIIN